MFNYGSLVDKLVELISNHEYNEKAMEQECIVKQILLVAMYLDLSDEFGRRRLVSLVRYWIINPQVPSTLISQFLQLYALFESNQVCVLIYFYFVKLYLLIGNIMSVWI